MATCDACGADENMPYNCRHCGGVFCSDHRLPENHGCPGLEQWNDPGPVFDSGFDDSVGGRGRGRDRGPVASALDALGVDTGPGGPLGYVRGNVAYVFLALIVVVFGVQFVLAPLLGAPAYSPGWFALFTLTTENPGYVWTWLTSVFAHGSPMHLLFNAIVLYFFGPLVERQVGSRKFAALFVGAGVVAGLAQVGLGIATGETVRVLGASGALMAVMGVLAVTTPDLKVLLFFFIPMSIRTLTILFAGFSVFAVATQAGGGLFDGVAHFAHLTGLVVGLWYGNRIKDRVGGGPRQLNLGPGRGGGPGGPGGPGRFP